MTLPLRLASIVFNIALFVALASGWYLIWFPSVGRREIISHIFYSSLLMILVAGFCIVVCAALARLQRNSNRTTNSPADE